jgi:hypothetical protein
MNRKDIIDEIKKELLEMTNQEIEYLSALWADIEKVKKDLSKDEILDIADAYIDVLKDKIKRLEDLKNNKKDVVYVIVDNGEIVTVEKR